MASKGRDRMIYERPDGTWANKRNDSDRASSVHKTQRDAADTAKEMLQNQGGGDETRLLPATHQCCLEDDLEMAL